MRFAILALVAAWLSASSAVAQGMATGELIFPLEDWHNHGSCIVECPNGDFLVCWFHGSGERKSDDVEILGARWVKATRSYQWPLCVDLKPTRPSAQPI